MGGKNHQRNSLHRNDSSDIPYEAPRLPGQNGNDEKLAPIRVVDIGGKTRVASLVNI